MAPGGFTGGVEDVAEVGEGAELNDADGADALAEDLGDVLVAQIVDEAHDYDLALLAREMAHLVPDALAVVFQLAGVFWRVSCAFGLQRFRELSVAVVLEGFLVVDGEVAGDAEEPGGKGDATLFVAGYRLEGVEEGLGGKVFGELRVAGEEDSVAQDSGPIAFIQAPERFAVAGSGERYQLLVIGLCEARPTHATPPFGWAQVDCMALILRLTRSTPLGGSHVSLSGLYVF